MDFVRSAILPDWWEKSCEADSTLLPDIEIRLARFLQRPLSDVRDPEIALTPPEYPGAQLRRVRNLKRDRLAPAIYSAIHVAGAVVRSLRKDVPPVSLPPLDGTEWRNHLTRPGGTVQLDPILDSLWQHGIPVISIDVLPSPKFQGMAAIVEGRPVIVLGHRHDEPAHNAFIIAHEARHIVANDCAVDCPVVDEEEEISDNAEMERLADAYATRVLVGSDTVPSVTAGTYRDLAHAAVQIERQLGADASAIIFAWARSTRDYAMAKMAVKALFRESGGQKSIRRHFDRFVDCDSANESDRDLLRCVHGDPDRNETSR